MSKQEIYNALTVAFQLMGAGGFFIMLGKWVLDKLIIGKRDKMSIRKEELNIAKLYQDITKELEAGFNKQKLELNEQFKAEKLKFEHERSQYQNILMEERIENKREINNYLERLAEAAKEKEELLKRIKEYEKLMKEYEKEIDELKARISHLENKNPH